MKLRNLVGQGNLEAPDKASLTALKAKLESGLKTHYRAFQVLAPLVPATKLTPQAVHKDPIRLPSHFTSAEREAFDLQPLATLELTLRVPHGHDWIEKVKSKLGIRSFATRHAKQTHGQDKNTRAQKARRSAERKVQQAAAIYDRNWDRLKALSPPEASLKGLQKLQSSELKLLGTWLEEEMYKRKDTMLPWFWSLHPLPTGDGSSSDVQAQIEAWNEEGMLLLVFDMGVTADSLLAVV